MRKETNYKGTKIIFLDFDGVLTIQEDSYQSINPERGELLRQIVAASGAKVVITSDWRYDTTLDQLRDMLIPYVKPKHVLGTIPMSPDKKRDRPRQDDIRFWLETAECHVTNFVIIDDEFRGLEQFQDRLVMTSGTKGINLNNVRTAINMLKGEYKWNSKT